MIPVVVVWLLYTTVAPDDAATASEMEGYPVTIEYERTLELNDDTCPGNELKLDSTAKATQIYK